MHRQTYNYLRQYTITYTRRRTQHSCKILNDVSAVDAEFVWNVLTVGTHDGRGVCVSVCVCVYFPLFFTPSPIRFKWCLNVIILVVFH